MNYSIIYFSGTGNTEWVSENFQKIITSKGFRCTLDSITEYESAVESAMNADMIVLAMPIYAADIPRIMRSFIKNLSDMLCEACSAKRDVIFVNTFGYVNGAGLIRARQIMKDTCLSIKGYINIRMTNTAPSPKPLKYGSSMDITDKTRVLEKLDKAFCSLIAGRKVINGLGPIMFGGILIRRILLNGIRNNYRNLKVDMSSCTECMMCVENCPTESIRHEAGKFIFADTCEACMRCINHCPEKAVSNK